MELHTEASLECSSAGCEGSLGKHWFLRKAGRVLTARASLAVFEFRGSQRPRRARCCTGRIQMSLSAFGAWLESAMKKGSKAVQEHSAAAHKKGFYCSNPFFCTEWVLAAGPDNGSPPPCLGWGSWVCRGTPAIADWQIPSPASDLLPCTVCTGFFPASSR